MENYDFMINLDNFESPGLTGNDPRLKLIRENIRTLLNLVSFTRAGKEIIVDGFVMLGTGQHISLFDEPKGILSEKG